MCSLEFRVGDFQFAQEGLVLLVCSTLLDREQDTRDDKQDQRCTPGYGADQFIHRPVPMPKYGHDLRPFGQAKEQQAAASYQDLQASLSEQGNSLDRQRKAQTDDRIPRLGQKIDQQHEYSLRQKIEQEISS